MDWLDLPAVQGTLKRAQECVDVSGCGTSFPLAGGWRPELTLIPSLRAPQLLDVGMSKQAAQQSWTFTRKIVFSCPLRQAAELL